MRSKVSDPRDVQILVSFMQFYKAYCKATMQPIWAETSYASAQAIWRHVENIHKGEEI